MSLHAPIQALASLELEDRTAPQKKLEDLVKYICCSNDVPFNYDFDIEYLNALLKLILAHKAGLDFSVKLYGGYSIAFHLLGAACLKIATSYAHFYKIIHHIFTTPDLAKKFPLTEKINTPNFKLNALFYLMTLIGLGIEKKEFIKMADIIPVIAADKALYQSELWSKPILVNKDPITSAFNEFAQLYGKKIPQALIAFPIIAMAQPQNWRIGFGTTSDDPLTIVAVSVAQNINENQALDILEYVLSHHSLLDLKLDEPLRGCTIRQLMPYWEESCQYHFWVHLAAIRHHYTMFDKYQNENQIEAKQFHEKHILNLLQEVTHLTEETFAVDARAYEWAEQCFLDVKRKVPEYIIQFKQTRGFAGAKPEAEHKCNEDSAKP